jgi:hypothetical protein
MFGRKESDVGLLPKDVLVDLESNPKRADEMIERIIKGEDPVSAWDGSTFITATASARRQPTVTDLERALADFNGFQQRQWQLQQANFQNQEIGGLSNGLNRQSLGNALGGLGGLLGPQR